MPLAYSGQAEEHYTVTKGDFIGQLDLIANVQLRNHPLVRLRSTNHILRLSVFVVSFTVI